MLNGYFAQHYTGYYYSELCSVLAIYWEYIFYQAESFIPYNVRTIYWDFGSQNLSWVQS